ncbi:hypothetical protein [Nostoc linckia]|uniref:hypothetical protein n=1 Tax=Nostoc linckia TaxID=92942 RepID=UPI000BFFD27E|nr:hypothetical protein [Nostoc linckia]
MSKVKKLIILVACGALMSSCQQSNANKTVVEKEPSPATQETPQPTPSVEPQKEKANTFEDAESIAISATTIASSSYSKDDWNLVASRWGEAISLMKSVPKESPNYATAQKKIVEYQKNLVYAQSRLSGKPTQAQVQPQLQTPKPQPQTQTSANTGVAEQESAQKFLEAYFNAAITEGSDGSDRWCSQSGSLQESLFSPRSYRILGVQKHGTAASPSYRFQTTVESSTRGGSPVINNWGFYVMKEENKTKAKSLPDGWCLGFIARP